jgi:hypothetical protein
MTETAEQELFNLIGYTKDLKSVLYFEIYCRMKMKNKKSNWLGTNLGINVAQITHIRRTV